MRPKVLDSYAIVALARNRKAVAILPFLKNINAGGCCGKPATTMADIQQQLAGMSVQAADALKKLLKTNQLKVYYKRDGKRTLKVF